MALGSRLVDFPRKGWCYEGQKCSKAHGEEELGKPIQVTATKKRSRDGEDSHRVIQSSSRSFRIQKQNDGMTVSTRM